MNSNLYVLEIGNNAVNEYYNLKRRLNLTKEEQDTIKNLRLLPNYFMKSERNKVMFDKDLNMEYQDYFGPMIEALKHGYESYGDIENYTNIRKGTLSVFFDNFYKYLAKLKLVKPETEKSKRQGVIDFVGSRLLDNEYSELLENEPQKNKITRKSARVIPKRENNTSAPQKSSALQKLDFSQAKEKIKTKISKLQEILTAMEVLETALAEELL